jgi:Arc/MetJ-type ribon-helix-helix transcriptional regulator
MARSPLQPLGPVVPADAYNLHDPGYDVNQIYTTAGEQSESVRARIPLPMLGEMRALIESKDIPEYRTMSDFVRDAIHHRLRWVADNFDKLQLNRVLNTQSLIDGARKREQQMEGERLAVQTTQRVLQQALGNRDWLQFDGLIAEATGALDGMTGVYQQEMVRLVERMEREARVARDA